MPQTPWVQIHSSFGKERRRIEVVGKLRDDLPHGIAIVFGGLLQVGVWIGREALRHSLNVSLLTRGSARSQIARFLDRFMSSLVAIGVRRIVVVRSYRFRNAPIRHGESWIEFRCVLK